MSELEISEYVNFSQYTPEDIAELVKERDKYKKALEDIAEQFTPRNAFTAKHDRLVDIAKEALK